jgi:hypothetical protein
MPWPRTAWSRACTRPLPGITRWAVVSDCHPAVIVMMIIPTIRRRRRRRWRRWRKTRRRKESGDNDEHHGDDSHEAHPMNTTHEEQISHP